MAARRSLPDVVTLADPRPGTVVGLAPGSRLCLGSAPGSAPAAGTSPPTPGTSCPWSARSPSCPSWSSTAPRPRCASSGGTPRSDAVREVCELRIEVGEADELAVAGRRSA